MSFKHGRAPPRVVISIGVVAARVLFIWPFTLIADERSARISEALAISPLLSFKVDVDT
jgi:hypothetical protein